MKKIISVLIVLMLLISPIMSVVSFAEELVENLNEEQVEENMEKENESIDNNEEKNSKKDVDKERSIEEDIKEDTEDSNVENNKTLLKSTKSSQTITNGVYIIRSKLNSKKVLDISEGSTKNGANLQIWEEDNVQQQKFIVSYNSEGYYQISVCHSDKLLDVAGAGKTNGTNVQQYESNKSDAQKWIIEKNEDNTYSVISKCNDLYLDISGASTKNGTNIQVYEGNKTNAQKFIFEKTEELYSSEIKNGVYTIHSALNEEKVLDVKNGGTSNGTNVQIYQDTNEIKQRFYIEGIGNGYYRILEKKSGKSLDVAGAGKSNGTNVQIYESNNSDAQKWIIKDNGDGTYSIISKANKLYIDVSGGSTLNGTNVQMYEGNNTYSQKFKLIEVDELKGSQDIDDGLYTIITGIDESKALEVKDGNKENSGNIQIGDKLDVKYQKFFVKYLGNGYYTITANYSNKVFDVGGASTLNGANVDQYESNNTDAQKWIIKAIGNDYYNIISKCNELYLNVDDTNINTFQKNNSESQKFKFEKVSDEMILTDKISDGVYCIETALSSSKVIESSNGNPNNGINIQLWDKIPSKQQKFQITYKNDGYYEIKIISSDKVMEIAGASVLNGANVQQYEFNNSDAQKWILKDVGNGYYNIISKENGLYLDVANSSVSNGSNIRTCVNNNSANQKFKFIKTSTVSGTKTINNGTYVIESALNTNKVLDISGGSTSNNANVQIWDFANVSQQRFKVTYKNNGYYEIIAVNSNKSLDVQDFGGHNGANVQQFTSSGVSAQSWIIKEAGNGYYYIISKCNDLYMDVSGANTTNGTNIQMYEGNQTNSQKFKFSKMTSGVDVSLYNGDINWTQVKNAGIDFAMIRVGLRGGASEGNIIKDKKFNDNIRDAHNNGIKCGIYFFSQALNASEGKVEAEKAIQYLRESGYSVEYPIAIDVETLYYWSPSQGKTLPGRANGLSKQARTEAVKAFCDKIREAGYIPMIYANIDYIYNKMDMSQLSSYELWLANWTFSPNVRSSYPGAYTMWQYTDCGAVSGITGNDGKVDLNICFKDY